MENPDLTSERQNPTFSTLKLRNILDGGEDVTRRKQRMVSLVENDRDYDRPDDFHFMTRDERYSDATRRAMLRTKKQKELGITEGDERYWYSCTVFPNEADPQGLHRGMFLPTIEGQGTEEQKKYWMEKIEREGILGTYAQTEMGHGTFLRGVETTSTYDEKTQEFVINSPTLTSTKWWPGSLGKTSNYAVVLAILYLKGRAHGIQPFIVQIRDIDTHQPLPGVTVGDIGPKFGYSQMDNGFLRFDHVRIPRTNMLMKNSQVLADGTFVKSKHDKLTYGTMIFVRVFIVKDEAVALAQACTIAIRYSCVRRQSEMVPGQPEPKVLDFQSQQQKLFSCLSGCLAYLFTGNKMLETYRHMNAQIMKGDVQTLPELHALSSGLKAYISGHAVDGVEICRRSCGGHGYSHAAGIAKIYEYHCPSVTYEGENTVMFLQCARYLMKCVSQAQAGQSLPSSVAYLSDRSVKAINLHPHSSLDNIVRAFQARAQRLIEKAALNIHKATSNGKLQHEAWNMNHIYLLKAAEAHLEAYIMGVFADQVTVVDDRAIQGVLDTVCRLWAFNIFRQHSGDFLQDSSISAAQLNQLEEHIPNILQAIRPQAVNIVDSFGFTDRQLGSVLGRYDGHVYENLLKWAQASPLNREEVHHSFEKYVKPLRASKL